MEIPAEYQEIIDDGRIMEELLDHPGYKILLARFEFIADSYLSELRKNESSDPRVNDNLARRWKVAESVLKRVQEEVLRKIRLKDDTIRMLATDDEQFRNLNDHLQFSRLEREVTME